MELIFLFVYVTNKTMQHERDFLQGIRWIRFRRLTMMESCPFLVLSVLIFCVALERLCPDAKAKKLFEQIQNLKFQWIPRHIFDKQNDVHSF